MYQVKSFEELRRDINGIELGLSGVWQKVKAVEGFIMKLSSDIEAGLLNAKDEHGKEALLRDTTRCLQSIHEIEMILVHVLPIRREG